MGWDTGGRCGRGVGPLVKGGSHTITGYIGQYYIKVDNFNETKNKSKSVFSISENALTYNCRAKYYPQPDGTMKLAQIQTFSVPKFRESGWEQREKPNKCSKSNDIGEEADSIQGDSNDIERATRRARKNAFDIIMCNPDLDTFATFTYAPEKVGDKADYDDCYKYLKPWLSNRVQRNGLKYVCVPELTKVGDIHFHAIMNSSALKLRPAISPKSGRLLTHGDKPLYNITDWKRGFTSAEKITRSCEGEDERAKVAKYIFKYMRKQEGQKIGGRYVLIGGDVQKPFYAYGDAPSQFMLDNRPIWQPEPMLIGDVTYSELGFI